MELPSVDIYIYNVTCTFSVGCNLSLDKIRLPSTDVTYKKKKGRVIARFRHPSATTSIYSSGKITITGSNSEEHAEETARKCASELEKMGFDARVLDFKVLSIFGTCLMPFAIRIRSFTEKHPQSGSYEPELHHGIIYKLDQPCKATLQIYHTGSITVSAPAVGNISEAIEYIYPLVEAHRMPLTEDMIQKRLARKRKRDEVDEDEEETTDDEEQTSDDEEQTSDDEQANEGAGDEGAEDEGARDEEEDSDEGAENENAGHWSAVDEEEDSNEDAGDGGVGDEDAVDEEEEEDEDDDSAEDEDAGDGGTGYEEEESDEYSSDDSS